MGCSVGMVVSDETRRVAGVRLDPQDEYLHEVDADTFNESVYTNFFDPTQRVGGFLRIGNRPREGHAEMTVCLYLPDGRVGFTFARPEVQDNERFDAGGMRVEVMRPFELLRWSYSGRLLLLEDPGVLADPRAAFTTSPQAAGEVSFEVRGLSPVLGGEPTQPVEDPHGGAFAKGHYEQHVGLRGSLRVGEQSWQVDGYGLRDHSWGARTWQAPWWYRWLTANFGDDRGFVVSIIATRDGRRTVGGVLFADGRYHLVRSAEVDTDWTGDPACPRAVRVRARTREHTFEASGTVLSLVPLRNRRTGPDGVQRVTRIAEALTEWRLEGRTGYGMSEYLDQLVDGTPAGLLP